METEKIAETPETSTNVLCAHVHVHRKKNHRKTSKTPEGRSATFKVQGKGFFLFLLFFFHFFIFVFLILIFFLKKKKNVSSFFAFLPFFCLRFFAFSLICFFLEFFTFGQVRGFARDGRSRH